MYNDYKINTCQEGIKLGLEPINIDKKKMGGNKRYMTLCCEQKYGNLSEYRLGQVNLIQQKVLKLTS